MSFSKRKKAQGSIEFVSIAAVMLLIFLGMFVVIQGRIGSAQRSRVYNSLEETARLISTEIRLANSMDGSYSRNFFLPYTIDGFNYTLNLDNQNEISISAQENDFVLFLDDNVSGWIKKGVNVIRKIEDNVSLNQLCPLGAGTDDPFCGEISCSGRYVRQGVEGATKIEYCYNRESIKVNRCVDVDQCIPPNSPACDAQPLFEIVYTCGLCTHIIGNDCKNTVLGSCKPYGPGVPCGPGMTCDNNGNCLMNPCDGDGICESGETPTNCPSDCLYAFVVTNNIGEIVAGFSDDGSITIRGSCTTEASCSPPAGSFVFGSSGTVTAYIDDLGNLCYNDIHDNNCRDNDANCNSPGADSFVVANSTGTIVSYVDSSGDLCLIGDLTENTIP